MANITVGTYQQNLNEVNQLLSDQGKSAANTPFATAVGNSAGRQGTPVESTNDQSVMAIAMADAQTGGWKPGQAVPSDLVNALTTQGGGSLTAAQATSSLTAIMTDVSSGSASNTTRDLQQFLQLVGDGDDGGVTAGKDANAWVQAMNLAGTAAGSAPSTAG